MRRLILMCLLAATVVPAALAAGTPTSAQTDCTKLRAQMGTSFTSAYATFGACVSKYAQIEQQANTSAQTTCTTQQADTGFAAAHAGKTFAQFYGNGKNGRNAFGNCVSATAKASSQAEQQGRMNPSQTCRALRTQMTAPVFGSTYGKNAGDQNAFGKCVSKTAQAQVQNELSASKACSGEQSANAQTFEQTYGTFGKCVSAKAKAAATAQQQATVTASKACSSELKAGAAAFRTKYGTFGHCVSQKAKA